MEITFKRRVVHFGTRFESAAGFRQAFSSKDAHQLFQNEIAVDVGGCCFNYNSENKLVFDHHFASFEAGFPSAAAAILHNAKALHKAFYKQIGTEETPLIWIVFHENPDFDALCSSYLVENIINQQSDDRVPLDGWMELGLHPNCWKPVDIHGEYGHVIHKRINWFDPELPSKEEYASPLLLASYSSCVDNCRNIRCSRTEALHSILYAAIVRRSANFSHDGATHFFRAASEAIKRRHLNPLYDPLFGHDSDFAPELHLLDREISAYQRDLKKARRCLVHLPKTTVPFDKLLQILEGNAHGGGIPLLEKSQVDGKAQLRPDHLEVFSDQKTNSAFQADGLFIRDPECLLFKEWARNDYENTFLGRGFIFTAIAYSNGRPESSINHSDYYFSLDPEKVPGAHLYKVWARLQCEEVRALQLKVHKTDAGNPRIGFTNRAGGMEPYFSDPWFDGSNYSGTIVVTPAQGTMISEAGKRTDLSDDRIAAIVSEELEYSIFDSPVLVDFPLSPTARPKYSQATVVLLRAGLDKTQPAINCFRFVQVRLAPSVETDVPSLANQIARSLWLFLEPSGAIRYPDDLEQHHLSTYANSIVTWSRRGVAIAYKAEAEQHAQDLKTNLEHLSNISFTIFRLLRLNSTDNPNVRKGGNPHYILQQWEDLLKSIVELRILASKPENRALRQLMDALRFDSVIQGLHALNQQAIGREEESRIVFLNLLIGLFALTFALPTLILTFFADVHGPSETTIAIISCTPVACGIIGAIGLCLRYRRHGKRKAASIPE